MAANSEKLQLTPLSLGINLQEGLLQILIPRNTPIPTKVEKVFVSSLDNQSKITVIVCEGERVRAKDNRLIGEFTLHGIPPAPRGLQMMTICFQINVYGVLDVSAQLMDIRRKDKVNITFNNIWPSKKDTTRMIQEAIAYQFDDLRHKEKAVAFVALQDYAYKMKNRLKVVSSKEERTRMKRAIEDALRWLNANKLAEAENIRCRKMELKRICNSVLHPRKKRLLKLLCGLL